jgi:hypothetical protein
MKHPITNCTKIIFASCFLIAGILCYLTWPLPRATATIQIHPSFIAIPSNGHSHSGYMENECKIILSNEALTIAANTLAIPKDQHNEAFLLIKKNTKTNPIRGTDFIEITVKNKAPDQAAKIANAIAEAYAQRRAEMTNARAKKILKILDGELSAQKEMIDDHRKDLEVILESHNLEFPADDKTFPKANDLPAGHFTGDSDPFLRRHPYDQALETFEQSRAMLREMKIKQKEARILLKMPRKPITIHKRAE